MSRDPYEELRVGFTAAVSHELRTPLARLLALIDGATLPGADPAEALAKARVEVERMDELIDDVLFLSELETGREVVSLGTTVAAPVVREVIDNLGESSERAGVEVRLDAEDDRLELPLRARMLRIVVQNLLLNALRHAGEGATCVVTLQGEDGGRLLSVSDNGPGVAPEDLPRLFERFYRADRARVTRGSGLGLAIVKHVVESAGGRVEARGASGAGLEIRSIFPGS